MRRVVLSICILVVVTAVGLSQHPDDDDKRSFTELGPILIDVDGDRKVDRIQPRT